MSGAATAPRRSAVRFAWMRPCSLAAGALVLYWIYGHRPLIGQPWQWADDGLYLRQAESIVRWLHGDSREWLGPYDAILLSKAPLFPMWLAARHMLHLPLRVAEFALLLGLPWLFRAAVRPAVRLTTGPLAFVSLLLVAQPFLPGEYRLLRASLHTVVASGCLIAVIGLLLRVRRPDDGLGFWSGLTGLFFGLSYINREEAVWLLPVLAAGALAILVGARRQRRWLRPSVALSLAVAAPLALVSTLNYVSYGVFFTTARRAPGFTRAVQAMSRLEPDARERYVNIPAATRAKAYRVSPRFNLLRGFLEGREGDEFASSPPHIFLNRRPAGTREFFVSNFEFALRQAAFRAGARTARASDELFDQIGGELEHAVRAGRLRGGSAGPSVLAAPLPGDYGRILGRSLYSLGRLYVLDCMAPAQPLVSSGDAAALQRMANLADTVLAPTKDLVSVKLPEPGASVRQAMYRAISFVQMLAYALGTGVIVAYVFSGRWRADHDLGAEMAYTGLILAGALVAFSLSMGVVDVLGFPIVETPWTYNAMGYAPLSVLGAFACVLALRWRNAWTSRGLHDQ